MADDTPTNKPPGGNKPVDKGTGAINKAEKDVNDAIKRVGKVSSVNAALMKMSKKPDVEVRESYGTSEGRRRIVSNIDIAVKNLARASAALADGAKTITFETARGVKNITIGGSRAIISGAKQYGQAIGEDINFNRQNLMVTSIGKISPLVGYSVAKMMQTQVFKDMVSNVKTKLGQALSSVGGRFKSLIGGGLQKGKQSLSLAADKIRGRGKVGIKEDKDSKGGVQSAAKKALNEKLESVISGADSQAEIQSKVENIEKKIPHLAKGGYVEKTGIIKAHAGEVITPVKDVVEAITARLDEYREGKKLGAEEHSGFDYRRRASEQKGFMSEIIDSLNVWEKNQYRLNEKIIYRQDQMEVKSINPVKTFMRMYKQEATQHERPWQERLLREMILVKVAMYGKQQEMLKVAWEKTLLEHPSLRMITGFSRLMTKAISTPLRFIFGKRGGYEGDLPSATDNAFATQAEILGMIYAGEMYRLDRIVHFTELTSDATRSMQEYFTGKKSEEKKLHTKVPWTMAGGAVDLITMATRYITKKTSTERSREVMGRGGSEFIEEKGVIEKAKEIADRMKWGFLGKVYGIKKREEEATGIAHFQPWQRMLLEYQQEIVENTGIMAGTSSGGKFTGKEDIQQKQITLQEKALEVAQEQNDNTKKMSSRLGGTFSKLKDFLMLVVFPAISSLASSILEPIKLIGRYLGGGVVGLVRALVPALPSVASASIGAVLGVLGAGALGAAVGTLLFKHVVKPMMDKSYADLVAKIDKERGKSDISIQDVAQRAQKGGTQEKIGAIHQIEMMKGVRMQGADDALRTAQRKSMGWGISESSQQIIQSIQSQYMAENINDYLMYGSEQISRLRAEWIKQGGYKHPYRGSAKDSEMIERYGRNREAAFLQYVKKTGRPISQEQLEFLARDKSGGIYSGIGLGDNTELAKMKELGIKTAGRVKEKAVEQYEAMKPELERRKLELQEEGNKINKELAEGIKQLVKDNEKGMKTVIDQSTIVADNSKKFLQQGMTTMTENASKVKSAMAEETKEIMLAVDKKV